MMARQSCHAVRRLSALVLSSNRSATSRTSVPRALDDTSAKSVKKASMSCGAVSPPLRYDETWFRNWATLLASLPRRLAARSTAALWRTRLARSSGVRLDVSVMLSEPIASTARACAALGVADRGVEAACREEAAACAGVGAES